MVLQIWKEKPGKRQHIDEISTCVQSWWIARERGFPLLAYSFKYWSGSLLGSVSVSSDLRSHLWLPVFFSQWKIKGLVPTNTHFPLGQLAGKHKHHCLPAVHSCPGAVPSARHRRMLLLAWHSSWSGWRTGREPFWHTFRKIFFLYFLPCCPLIFLWLTVQPKECCLTSFMCHFCRPIWTWGIGFFLRLQSQV